MTFINNNREVQCDGCLSITRADDVEEWVSYGTFGGERQHYHGTCWQTGWYTGIEPKGEWPIEEGKPPANLPRRNEEPEPAFDHVKGSPEKADPVNSPGHYTWLNGIEVIEITEHFNFLLGNVLKYVMRADHKGKPIEDLEKAAWYLSREIANRKSSDVV